MGRLRVCRRRVDAKARFISDQRGVAAVLFALMLPPILMATGAAVDFARIGMLKTSLQSVTDGAALAGASSLYMNNAATEAQQAAQDYYAKGTVPISRYATVGAATVTLPSSIEVTVTASATLPNTFMRMVGMNEVVSVTSSAEGPAYQLQVSKPSGFTSSAYDSNSIFFYKTDSTGTPPSSSSAYTLLFTNDPNVDPNYQTDNAANKNISIAATDYVGFLLLNKTEGLKTYSGSNTNAYGGQSGSEHLFFSSLPIPSSYAYSSQGTFYNGSLNSKGACQTAAITSVVTNFVSTESGGCGPHPCTEMSGSTVLQNNLLVAGNCSSQSTALLTCQQLYTNPVSFGWNDMGGPTDDFDYQNANYTIQCIPAASGPTQPSGVVLVN